ncbi:MAG TPA: lysyl oxidase family protein, partial [Chloroflexota bacterium]|nr:lysyl oxidase family protein [Chloroflexota bacterium]
LYGAKTCLRFDATMPNVGEGEVQARFAFPHDPNDTSQNVFQRVFYSDGQDHFADTLIGQYTSDPIATAQSQLPFEFFQHYALTQLWASDAHGHFVGQTPVRSAKKSSFCVEDEKLDNVKWGENGVAARKYFAPYCLFPTVTEGNFDYAIQGLSIGWQDLYEFYLPGQYIEVSGLPDGSYILSTTVNPDRVFLESDYKDNCITRLVQLASVDSPNRRVVDLGPGPKCLEHDGP